MKNYMWKNALKAVILSCTIGSFTLCSGAITVPNVGTQYSIGSLFNLINTNNPSKTSNFLIALNGTTPIPASQAWGTVPNGSGSAALVGMTSAWITQNESKQVTLQQDSALISILQSQGHLLSGDVASYQKILLYFTYQISTTGPVYRFYINDPFPGIVRNVGGVLTDPAQTIIAKWNVAAAQ